MTTRKVAVTLPGKIGDILWALPTVRLMARESGHPVRLVLPEMWKGLRGLLLAQDYISEVTLAGSDWWPITFSAPITPRAPIGDFYLDEDETRVDLGYWDWPLHALPFQYWHNLREVTGKEWPELDMSPWIAPCSGEVEKQSRWIYYGASEQWIELKMGVLLALLNEVSGMFHVPGPPSGRHLEFEVPQSGRGAGDADFRQIGWVDSANLMALCKLYVGCCSSQWVLACAMGVPVVLFDPDPGRHNEIFWWDGGGRNEKVLGADGLPTWDARAVVQAVVDRLNDVQREV